MDAFFVARSAVEAAFIGFHVSVLACVIRQRKRNNSSFVKTFFTVYMLQSCADIVNYILAFIFTRLARYGYVPAAFYEHPLSRLIPFTMMYAFYFQFVAHVVIALNRYSVLSKIRSAVSRDCPTSTWLDARPRNVLVALLLVPLPGAALRLLGNLYFVPTQTPGIYAFINKPAWHYAALLSCNLIYGSTTAVLSIIFELRSLVLFHKLSLIAQRQYRNDFLLLVYALVQFAAQFAFCVYFVLTCYAAATSDGPLLTLVQSFYTYLVDFFSMSAPVCLFSTSNPLRTAYKSMFLSRSSRVSSVTELTQTL